MKTKDIVLISLFTAMTAIGAFLNIPTPTVPFSMQFFFCAFAGVLLGAKKAFISQVLYVAIGLAGLPVFTKGGGIGYVLQPSFGFILGFAACAAVIGFVVHGTSAKSAGHVNASTPGIFRISLAVLAGLLSTYLIGVPYLYFMVNYLAAPGSEITFAKAVSLGFTPFILFDLVKCAIVIVTSAKILPILRRYGYTV